MFAVSIMLNGKDFKGHTPMRNILLARNTKTALKADLDYIIGLGNVLGWAMFDQKGHQEDSWNGGMCLNWTSREFDDIDVCFGSRY